MAIARQILTFSSSGGTYRLVRQADSSFSIEKGSRDALNQAAWSEVGNIKATMFDVNRMTRSVLYDLLDQYVRVELAAKSKSKA